MVRLRITLFLYLHIYINKYALLGLIMKLTKIQLKQIIREEIQSLTEKRNEHGLMVYPSTRQDQVKIQKWLDSSDYYAEWNRGGYFLFPEKKSAYNSLEDELGKQFGKRRINARFEGV